MKENLDVKQFAEKFNGTIEIHIHCCTPNKVMEIANDLGKIDGEYWTNKGSSGVRFMFDDVILHAYFQDREEKEGVLCK